MSDKIADILAYNNEYLATNTPAMDDAVKQIRQQIGRELLDAMEEDEVAVCNYLVREVCKMEES